MTKTIVVAIDVSKKKGTESFKKLPFEKQLSLIEKKIDMVCEKLSAREADNWIISWHENGLSNYLGKHGDSYLTLEQKKNFKELLGKLTQKYQKLILIGPVTSVREIDIEKQPEKVSKLKKFKNPAFFEGKPKLFAIRTTAYVANKGSITRHDKTIDYFEASDFIPEELGIFRLGKGNKGEQAKIDDMIGIELCIEHRLGILATEVSKKKPPLIQFILSDSTKIKPKYSISPYLIHIDSKRKIQMITGGSEKHTEVELYSCDTWPENSNLTEIKPTLMKSYIFSKILEIYIKELAENPFRSITKYITNECQLTAGECSELISFIVEKWIQQQCGPLTFYKITQIIALLVSLPSASNLSLDRETSKFLIESTIADNKKRPDKNFIDKIKAIPLHEVMETKGESVTLAPKNSPEIKTTPKT